MFMFTQKVINNIMNQKFSAIVSLPWNKGQKKVGTEEGAQWLAEYIETDLGQTAT